MMKSEEEKTDRDCKKIELSSKEERFVQAIINNEFPNSNRTVIADLGLSEAMFYRMKKKLKDVILERSRELFKSEVPSWFRSLSREAKKGDVAAMKLALEISREYIPFSRSEIEKKGEVNIRVNLKEALRGDLSDSKKVGNAESTDSRGHN